jgi:hypothetical protein
MSDEQKPPTPTGPTDPRLAANSGAANGAGQQPAAPDADADALKPRPRRKEETVSVIVHTAFRLRTDDDAEHEYGVGPHEMPKAHTEHWYAKKHIAPSED